MKQSPIPAADSVKTMLEMLFGDGLKVAPNDSTLPSEPHVATYIGDDGGLVGLCACDGAFVGYSGAALTMVPAAVAKEMIQNKDFSEMVLGNFYEVMNICSRLLMSEHSPHLRLDRTVAPGAGGDALAALGDDVRSAGFDIDIPRYGTGQVVFQVAAI